MEKFIGTSGPWQVVDTYKDYNEDSGIIIWDGDEQASGPICDMGLIGDMNYGETLANARLIASAPTLLEACQQIMHLYEQDGHLLNFKVDIVRIAIEKSLGDNQPPASV